MITGKGWFLAIVIVASLFAPRPGDAAIYSFVDNMGVLHFSNVPDDPRYRLVPGMSIPRRQNRPVLSRYNYDAVIDSTARRFNVDPHLVRAVIKTESNFDPRAVSQKGAMGLMQLMPETARDMEIQNPFDPMENIFAGTRYLRKLFDQFDGDLGLALAAYNAGPTLVAKTGGIPMINETIEYIKKVLITYKRYRQDALLNSR